MRTPRPVECHFYIRGNGGITEVQYACLMLAHQTSILFPSSAEQNRGFLFIYQK
jgi:hypothetical protein